MATRASSVPRRLRAQFFKEFLEQTRVNSAAKITTVTAYAVLPEPQRKTVRWCVLHRSIDRTFHRATLNGRNCSAAHGHPRSIWAPFRHTTLARTHSENRDGADAQETGCQPRFEAVHPTSIHRFALKIAEGMARVYHNPLPSSRRQGDLT